MRPARPLGERLAAQSVRQGDCRIWVGTVTNSGTGVVTIGREKMTARAASYEAATGEDAPDGLRMSCGQRLCIEASHIIAPPGVRRARPLWSYVAAPWDRPSGDGACLGRETTGVRCTLPAGPDELCIRHNRVAVQRERRRLETLANRTKG